MNRSRYEIIIPTINRSLYIEEAINSALNQSPTMDYSISVVYNEDDKEKFNNFKNNYGRSKKLNFKQNPTPSGVYDNWNFCINNSTGEFLIMLHDDDRLEDSFLSTVECILKENPDVEFLLIYPGNIDSYGDITFFNNLYSKRFQSEKLITVSPINSLLRWNYNSSGMVIKRNLAINLGLFDQSYYPNADLILRTKASLIGKLYAFMPKNFINYVRIHELQYSSNIYMNEYVGNILYFVKKSNLNWINKRYISIYLLFLDKKHIFARFFLWGLTFVNKLIVVRDILFNSKKITCRKREL